MTSYTEEQVEIKNLSNLLDINITVFSYRISDHTEMFHHYSPYRRSVQEQAPDEHRWLTLYHEIDSHFEVLVGRHKHWLDD